MYSLLVFLSHSMSSDDAVVVHHVRKAIIHQHCEIVAGSDIQHGPLSGSIQEGISSCDVAVCIATARAEYVLSVGTYAIPPWIPQEMAFAAGCQLKIIPLVENGVRVPDLKIPSDAVHIRFDRNNPVELVHSVSGAISDIQRPVLLS